MVEVFAALVVLDIRESLKILLKKLFSFVEDFLHLQVMRLLNHLLVLLVALPVSIKLVLREGRLPKKCFKREKQVHRGDFVQNFDIFFIYFTSLLLFLFKVKSLWLGMILRHLMAAHTHLNT